MSKRAISFMEDEGMKDGSKKSKPAAVSTKPSPTETSHHDEQPTVEQATPAEIHEPHHNSAPNEKQKDTLPSSDFDEETFSDFSLPDERQTITNKLDDGSHSLLLEYNVWKNTKCCAWRCLVGELPSEGSERIRSPYRLNLQAKSASDVPWSRIDKSYTSIYHVSCFENIGVDLAQHMELSRDHFHPAVTEWVETRGKAFDAKLYEHYYDALATYQRAHDLQSLNHAIYCIEEGCNCSSLPDKPNRSDFLNGEPTERSLTDILLHVIGADHLTPLLESTRIRLLERIGYDSKELTSADIAACEQNQKKSKVEKVISVADADVGVNESPSKQVEADNVKRGRNEVEGHDIAESAAKKVGAEREKFVTRRRARYLLGLGSYR